jgi:mycobactin salicyl-AMP ligase
MLVAMPTLPTTPVGKIDKKAIARQFSAAADRTEWPRA